MESPKRVTARANSNIAFIKYWGNLDDELRLPANPSLSMNLEGLYTETTVEWDPALSRDCLILNTRDETGQNAGMRVTAFLDMLRQRLNLQGFARVESVNNFPTGAGIASSASAFAALTLAVTAAAGLDLTERELTAIARLGSGSASRSIPTGFVLWHAGTDHNSSYAESIAGADYWELRDVIAIVSYDHKAVGSSRGHQTAATSDLQDARVRGAPERLAKCREAILDRNFAAAAEVIEHDSNLMHAVMMTSRPPLFYWMPATLAVMERVRRLRESGLQVCYTLDAGPNVHCICVREDADKVSNALRELSEIKDIRIASPGGGASIISTET